MFHIDVIEEVDGPGPNAGKRHGVWHWRCEAAALSGYSRQPLLDACRELQRTGAGPSEPAGLFRSGRDQPDMICLVGVGAGLTVDEGGPRFVKYRPFDAEFRNRAGCSASQATRAEDRPVLSTN